MGSLVIFAGVAAVIVAVVLVLGAARLWLDYRRRGRFETDFRRFRSAKRSTGERLEVALERLFQSDGGPAGHLPPVESPPSQFSPVREVPNPDFDRELTADLWDAIRIHMAVPGEHVPGDCLTCESQRLDEARYAFESRSVVVLRQRPSWAPEARARALAVDRITAALTQQV